MQHPLIVQETTVDAVLFGDPLVPGAEAWSVADKDGVPRLTFWEWPICQLYIGGRQMIRREYLPVYYATREAQLSVLEQGLDPFDYREYPDIQFLRNFNLDYVPARFWPYMPAPGHEYMRRNPSRARRRRKAVTPRRNPGARPNPGSINPGSIWNGPMLRDVPADSYLVFEDLQFDLHGDDEYNQGVLSIAYYDSRRVVTEIGLFSDGLIVDRDRLWDDAFELIAAHQLYFNNQRAVWVCPVHFPPGAVEYGDLNTPTLLHYDPMHELGMDVQHDPLALYPQFAIEHFPFWIASSLSLGTGRYPKAQLLP